MEPRLQELSDAFRVDIFRKINPKDNIEQQVLQLVQEFEDISKEDIANKLAISMYMVKKTVKKLREDNVLYYEGSSKNGKWSVK